DHRSTSSSTALYSSTHSLTNSDSSQSLSAENIASKLKVNKKERTVIDVKGKKANCWRCFGIPVQSVDGKIKEIYSTFVSCKYCYTTYSYSSSTKNMNKHMDICGSG
ncbi:unnamed protein product, partial [Adineta steineri]